MSINFKPGTTPGETIEEGGIIWEWDGEKWNRKSQGQGVDGYLLRHGEDVLDCPGPVTYRWNESVEFASGPSSLVFDNEGVKITETIEDTTVLKHIVDKQYVDQEVDVIQNEVIDLQEEIEAIAPSIDKGIWEFDNQGFSDGNINTPPLAGMYLLLKGDHPTGSYTDQYAEADAIVFNKHDYNNKLHENWDLVGTDKLIQLYDKPDPDFVLGEINSVLDLGDVDNPYVNEAAVVKIDRTESEGSPTNRGDTDGKYLTYVNIFSAPTGGDASLFVKKTGDNMEGELDMEGASGRNKIINLPTPTSDYDASNKEYVDKAVGGYFQAAGRKFQGVVPSSGYPAGESYFVTDNAQPGRVTKLYMHPDFTDRYFDGPDKTFKYGGWIYIYDTSGNKETLGMYFPAGLNTDSNGYRYFNVHGMGSTRNLIVGTNYGMGFAVSFNS